VLSPPSPPSLSGVLKSKRKRPTPPKQPHRSPLKPNRATATATATATTAAATAAAATDSKPLAPRNAFESMMMMGGRGKPRCFRNGRAALKPNSVAKSTNKARTHKGRKGKR
jgi:hypothetical protein